MLKLEFINVGYGDAILVEAHSRQGEPFRMLVDCGDAALGKSYPGSRQNTAARYLGKKGISRLDLLVITHLHKDHVGGLESLLQQVQVAQLWTSFLPSGALWEKNFAPQNGFSPGANALLQAMNIYIKGLDRLSRQGTIITEATMPCIREVPDTALRIQRFANVPRLHERQRDIWEQIFRQGPDNALLDELDGFINDTSLRMRLSYGGTTAELPGDTYARQWETYDISPCSIVKLPHHGHEDSFTPVLFHRLSPRYMVVSASRERAAQCPSPPVLEIANRGPATLFCTDAIETPGQEACFQNALGFQIDREGNISVYHVQEGVPGHEEEI